jgi:DMSO/TMAO reductase YedYZ molybdopterin-dependent catalytic subunit
MANPLPPEDVGRTLRGLTRRSFLTGLAAGGAGLAGWLWLRGAAPADGIPRPLRRVLEFNEGLGRAAFDPARLAPEFPRDRATDVRVNGTIGLGGRLDAAAWRLRVHGPAGAPRLFTLADVQALPAVSMTTELKCIEGWSNVVHWTGTRLADFVRHHGIGTADSLPGYVRLETPDGGYYVGLDRASALHPQTLLCYAMNGAPLTPAHGAPLRLVIPVKYGIKNIKRLGVLRFTDVRPGDYWAERGYDWYAGH